MNDGHSPGNLRWPPPSDDLEPFEVLEIVRDPTGRDTWRRDHRSPEMPEVYREWLPKRLGREATIQHDALDLFPAAAPAPDSRPTPALTVPRVAAPGATTTTVSRPVATAPEAVAVAPAPSSSAHRTFFATAERMSLLTAGALMGVVVALAGLRESTPDRAGDDLRAMPVTQEATPRTDAAALPARAIPRWDDPPVAPVTSVTGVAPGPVVARAPVVTPAPVAPPAPVPPAASPTRAVPLRVSSPAPARLAPPQAPTRSAVAELPANTTTSRRATLVTPRAARVARVSRPPVSEGPAVIGTVEQYATAWSRLDARATQALWPSVDRTALVGSFTAIREQRLTLAACTATVVADRAAVTCRGTLRYRPRVGEHSTRTARGRWTFDLARHDQAWVIATVSRP